VCFELHRASGTDTDTSTSVPANTSFLFPRPLLDVHHCSSFCFFSVGASVKVPIQQPYLGGGLGVALVDSDRNRGDDFNVEAGLNLVGGFEWGPRRRYLLEIRAGVGDIPDFKVTAGIGL
jgi:hypothetical protein